MRQKDQASRQDRYMLLTFEESPANIKVSQENEIASSDPWRQQRIRGLRMLFEHRSFHWPRIAVVVAFSVNTVITVLAASNNSNASRFFR